MRRNLVVLATVLLTMLGLGVVTNPARAAIRHTCDYWEARGHASTLILNSPVHIEMNWHPREENGTWTPGSEISVCISQPLVAVYQEFTWQHQWGGPQGGLLPDYGGYSHFVQGVGWASDGAVQAQTSASADTWPYLTNYGDGSYALTIPFKICIGPNCPLVVNQQAGIVRTGVVLTNFGLSPPPAGHTHGATLSAGTTRVYANGIHRDAPVNGDVGSVGTNPDAVRHELWWGNLPVCTSPTSCTNVPVPQGVRLTYSGANLGTATVGAVTVPIRPPLSSCYSIGTPSCAS